MGENSEITSNSYLSLYAENKRLFPDAFAGSKGAVALGEGRFAPSFFYSMNEALESKSIYRYLVSNDGQVYALYQSISGELVVPVSEDVFNGNKEEILSKMGYSNVSELPQTFASTLKWTLPKVPNKILRQIVGFFRSYVMENAQYEVALRVYWDVVNESFIIDCPKQVVTPVFISFEQMEQYAGVNAKQFIPVLEVHSHNVMRAFFSSTDDENEQSFNTTYGVFGVFGRLNRQPYEMVFRAKMRDESIDIQASELFDLEEDDDDYSYPSNWKNNVSVKDGFYL